MRFHVGFSFKPKDIMKAVAVIGGVLTTLFASGVLKL